MYAQIDTLTAGDLLVSEVLQDPNEVSDANGEWFEVVNMTAFPVDLDGLIVSDDGTDRFVVTGPLHVEVGARVVIGASTDLATNGGAAVDQAWTSFTLANTEDELVLSNAAGEVARLAWDAGARWPIIAGAAMSLDPGYENTTDAADAASWCSATSPMNGGDLGSPGATNDACFTTDDDGDGYDASIDCDDADPTAWLVPDVVSGDLTSGYTTFCPGYCSRALAGHLDLSGASDADVASLTCLTAVGGDLYIVSNPSLVSLSGLDALQELGGTLYIEDAPSLTHLTGLDALTHIGVAIFITTSGLVDMTGLEALTALDGYLDIEFNEAITSLTGLEGVTGTASDLIVYGNPNLPDLTGLGSVTSVGGVLMVAANDGLTSLAGLDALTTVGNNINIASNPLLCDAEVDDLLGRLTSWSGTLYRADNSGSCS